MDSIELVFRRSGECEVADAFIAMLSALGDGSRLCFQLPGDELFECRHAILLLACLVCQPSEIPKVFGHSFDNSPVGCEVRFVAGDEIAPMAAFSGAERVFDGAKQLYQFVALGIEPAVFDQDGGVAVGNGADDHNAGKDEPKSYKDAPFDRPMGEPLHEPACLGNRRRTAVVGRYPIERVGV